MAEVGVHEGARALADVLAAGLEHRAMEHVLGLLDAGRSVEEVVLEHLSPALAMVGRCWEADEWGVGESHAAATSAETVLAFLSARVEGRGDRGRVAVACAEDERHLLPARAVALVLRLKGWDTAFVGPSLPPDHLERYLGEDRPHALVLSCTVPMHLTGGSECIAAAHRAGVPVLAGGAAFGSDPTRARRLGADGWADGPVAAHERLVFTWPPPGLAAPLAPHADLAALRRARQEVVESASSRLRSQFPRLASLGPAPAAQWQRHLETLVATLEAAVLVDDEDLLVDHVRWWLGVVTARREAPELVPAAVAAVAAATRPLARVQQLLAAAELQGAEAAADAGRRGSPVARPAAASPPRPPVPGNERERLDALRRLRILDTPPEPAFDDLAHLAAKLCATPASAIALVDADRLWLKSKVGLDVSHIDRASGFCGWGILQRDVFVVPDSAEDERFAGSPLVTSDPGIRFYAGVPLVTAGDLALGMLWVGDAVPRHLGAEQRQELRALGRQASLQLELRAHDRRLDAPPPVLAADEGRRPGTREALLRELEAQDEVPGGTERLLRTREVALLFDVSERTVNYWASQGRLPSRQTAGGHRRYAAGDVLTLVRELSLASGPGAAPG